MRAFARSIVETAYHPMLVLDGRLRVVAANTPFFQTFDAPPEVEGRPLGEIGGGQWNVPGLRDLLEDALRGSRPDGIEAEFHTPGSGRRRLLLNARRVTRDDDDTPVVLLAAEDVTERYRARQALERLNAELEVRVAERTAELEAANRSLRESNRELEASNRELEAFSYSVSHDLRAPLRAIDGFSQELLVGHADRLDEQGRHYLRRVRTNTQRMGQLIDDLLRLARISRDELHREDVDLSALAESVAADLRARHPDRVVAFTARPGLRVRADARLIRVVLENLLANAWKFTARKTDAEVEFGRADTPDGPAFFVRDNGAGFDMAHANRLFGAFQRLHTEREFPGTGVGLATVQRVVRRHGGAVRAESTAGRGATFYFTLPGGGP